MRTGTIIGIPDAYTRFGRVRDENGDMYTIEPGELPKNVKLGDQLAYKVDLFSNGGGLAYSLKED